MTEFICRQFLCPAKKRKSFSLVRRTVEKKVEEWRSRIRKWCWLNKACSVSPNSWKQRTDDIPTEHFTNFSSRRSAYAVSGLLQIIWDVNFEALNLVISSVGICKEQPKKKKRENSVMMWSYPIDRFSGFLFRFGIFVRFWQMVEKKEKNATKPRMSEQASRDKIAVTDRLPQISIQLLPFLVLWLCVTFRRGKNATKTHSCYFYRFAVETEREIRI